MKCTTIASLLKKPTVPTPKFSCTLQELRKEEYEGNLQVQKVTTEPCLLRDLFLNVYINKRMERKER